MPDTVIKVENLSKRYVIGHESRHDNLRDTLHHTARKLWRRFRWGTGFQTEEFWALRDVSFEVKQGEVVGIIGRNGAGKSTLLKILSRITEPTSGRVAIRGRVASLLEVGTGFHPELSGRENIYLNGAILGMSRTEIRRKFDEIVAFAEVERFLDTPVKHYSSGMYVRLAFAVAAHLEPEILIIDEVLAVGDTAFQKKCLGKIGAVANSEGRTVLFVSHQMPAVANLCSHCLHLDSGQVVQSGPTEQVIQGYLQKGHAQTSVHLVDRRDRSGSGAIRFTSACVRFAQASEENHAYWASGYPGSLIIQLENRKGTTLKNLRISVGIDDSTGQRILLLNSELTGDLPQLLSADTTQVEIALAQVPLMPGTYNYTLFAALAGDVADWIENAGKITVEPGDFFGTGRLVPRSQGHFLVHHRFIASAPAKSGQVE